MPLPVGLTKLISAFLVPKRLAAGWFQAKASLPPVSVLGIALLVLPFTPIFLRLGLLPLFGFAYALPK